MNSIESIMGMIRTEAVEATHAAQMEEYDRRRRLLCQASDPDEPHEQPEPDSSADQALGGRQDSQG
jgi:hypothetical protein